MNKTLKFSRFSAKKRLFQYTIILILIIFCSLYTVNKVSSILEERRIEQIGKYKAEVAILKEHKEENLKRIEIEYDEKIQKLLDKIEKLEKK